MGRGTEGKEDTQAEADGQHQARLDRLVIIGRRGTILGSLEVTNPTQQSTIKVGKDAADDDGK